MQRQTMDLMVDAVAARAVMVVPQVVAHHQSPISMREVGNLTERAAPAEVLSMATVRALRVSTQTQAI